MNSFERKVVHDLVREEGLRSRSHGEEPNRHVTIDLKASAVDDDQHYDDEYDDEADETGDVEA